MDNLNDVLGNIFKGIFNQSLLSLLRDVRTKNQTKVLKSSFFSMGQDMVHEDSASTPYFRKEALGADPNKREKSF